MRQFLNVLLLINLLESSISIEIFKEKAWMDSRGKDNFFDYAEIAEPKYYYNINSRGSDLNNYSSNVDLDLFVTADDDDTIEQTNENQKNPTSSVINFLMNAIKRVISPEQQQKQKHHAVKINHDKETHKGLDIKLDSNTHLLPSLGNNQDLKFSIIGTKWCGAGDSARDKNDIGYFYFTDNCCREHDSCPTTLAAQETKYGLKNSGKFTRSHCDCDQKFFQCLRQVNTMLSNQVGKFYFNVLGHQCFREEYPLKTCKVSMKSRCLSYVTDSSKSKTYQWLDNPWF